MTLKKVFVNLNKEILHPIKKATVKQNMFNSIVKTRLSATARDFFAEEGSEFQLLKAS